MTINDIMTAVTNAKTQIKSAVDAARAEAPKGQKMPYGQHAQFVASSALAGQVVNGVTQCGYVAASCRFTKTGDLCVTYRAPKTLEARLSNHAASVEKRKAAVASRKAAREAKKAAVAVPSALSALANLKLAA